MFLDRRKCTSGAVYESIRYFYQHSNTMGDQTGAHPPQNQDDFDSGIPYRIIGIAIVAFFIVCCSLPKAYVEIFGGKTYDDTPWRLERNPSGVYATGIVKGAPPIQFFSAQLTVGCQNEEEFIARVNGGTWDTDASWYTDWKDKSPEMIGVQFHGQDKGHSWSIKQKDQTYVIQDAKRFVSMLGDRRDVVLSPDLEFGEGRKNSPVWGFGVNDENKSKIKRVLEACGASHKME